ncbi:uncharacterized protein CBL_05002 [Carabus blaptoides fortunei]
MCNNLKKNFIRTLVVKTWDLFTKWSSSPMGQCVSRKAAGAYGANSTSKPMARPHDYRQYQGQDGNRESSRHSSASHMRGAASSFGFKRRPTSAIPLSVDNEPTTRKPPTDPAVDNNGNDDNVDSLETISTTLFSGGRTTPRLAPPKKEANASRINRFGFRQANANRGSTRVPDTSSSTTQATVEYKNNNVEKEVKSRKTVSIAATLPKHSKATSKASETNNKNKPAKSSIPQPNAPAKFTFHSSQLPKPQMPVRVMDTKNAKTVANINRKVSSASQRSEEGGSSKEGSVTEDSGLGSHTSGGPNGNFVGDTDTLHGVELMDSSPTFGARKNKNSRTRNLDLIVSGKSFDVIDLDDSAEDGVVTEVAVIPLPRLPSVFGNNMSTGVVRERTMEYERQLDMNRRKISVTSSEGFSEDYGEEEKSFRDRSCTEKSGQGASRLFSPTKSFREAHSRKHSNKDSSPVSSDEQEWEQGGEAMAEVYSISFSSSDESKDKEFSPLPLRTPASNKQSYTDKSHITNSCTGALPKDNVRSVLLNRNDMKYTSMPDAMTTQMVGSLTGAIPKDTVRSVLLTIEDTQYSPEDMYSSRGGPVAQHMSTSSSSMSSSCSGTSRDLFKSLLPTAENAECLATNKGNPSDSSANSSLLTSPSMTSSSDSLPVPKDNLKSVLLSIEDPKFAAVAAASSGTLLDDETSPVDSLMSSYTESDEIVSKHKVKTSKSSTDSKDVNEKSPLSPESPGTPTNASLSLSEGRDFLIDDEIADQPALMFDDPVTVDRLQSANHNSLLFSDPVDMNSADRYCSEHQNISDSLATLVDSTPKLVRRGLRSCDGSPGPMRPRNPLLSRTASIDTLSPCESIASDDLMMDFEHSQSSGMDDSTDRLHLNESNALHSLDEATIRSELENQDASVAREWSSLLGTHSNRELPPHSVTRTNNFLRSRTNTPNSVPDSPRSLDRVRGLASSNSLLRSARTTHGSPAAYDSDDSLRLDRITHGSMVNDIVGIKTMLLKLKRVLQETEPHNPFDNQAILKNGLYNGLSNEQSDLDSVDCDSDFASNSNMEMAELRRQIEFLHSQLEDKDRTVQQLQNQVTKYSLGAHLSSGFSDREREMCNAATQTDRVRPLSAGPSLLQSLPTEGGMGPLVSANENARRSRPQSMVETHPSPSSALRAPPLKLWRKPGEPPPPSRYAQQASSLPRRARSRSRPAPTPS